METQLPTQGRDFGAASGTGVRAGNSFWRVALAGAGWAVATGCALTVERLARSGQTGPWGWEGWRELWAAVVDPRTQWMVALTLGLYVAAFFFATWRVGRNRAAGWQSGWLWLTLALGLCGVRYAWSYSEADQGISYVLWIAGVVLGWAMCLWVGQGRGELSPGRGLYLMGMLMGWLAILAGVESHGGRELRYHGVERWSGPWGDPNVAGLLMAVGMVLAGGWLWTWPVYLRSRIGNGRMRSMRGTARLLLYAGGVFALVVLGMCAMGGWRSYSRTAWLAAAVGMVILLGRMLAKERWRGQMGRIRAWGAVGVLAIVSLGYWDLRDSEVPWIRRIYSVVNPDDFSWRHRVIGWEAALQMSADRPWWGWGWISPGTVHRAWYGWDGPAEFGAIGLNSYLALAVQCGWLSLILLGVAVWLFARASAWECPGDTPHTEAARRLVATSLAGAGVLLTGFLFCSGLDSLRTGAWLWLLLGLGATVPGTPRGVRPTGMPVRWRVWWIGAIALAGAGLWMWAKAGDEFKRHQVRLRGEAGRTFELWWMERQDGRLCKPRVVYVPEPEGSWRVWGTHVTQMARLGLQVAATSLAAREEEEVARQLRSVRAFVIGQGGCGADRVVWVARGEAVSAVLRFLLAEGLQDPWVCVESDRTLRLPKMGPGSGEGGQPWARLGRGAWIWGGDSPVGAEPAVQAALRDLSGRGARVTALFVAPVAPMGWDQERLLFRVAGEACWDLLGHGEAARQTLSPGRETDRGPWWAALLPALVWAGGVGWWLWRDASRRQSHPDEDSHPSDATGFRRASEVVRTVAMGFILVAAGWHGVHLGLLGWPADERTAWWAKQRLVGRGEETFWDRLLAQVEWQGRPWKVWWEHAHLAAYNRSLRNWGVPEAVEERWVIDPRLDGEEDGDLEWRRWLWERLYPRVRYETTIAKAVAATVGYLRSEVGEGWWGEEADLRRMWRVGWATRTGFSRLCVAGLRSVGVPARLSSAGTVEYWENGAWHELHPVVRVVQLR